VCSFQKSEVIVLQILSGAQIQKVLDFSVSRSGSDAFSQVAGVRFAIADGRAANVQLLKDPKNPAAGYTALDPAASYDVVTSDYQALVAGGYKDIFAGLTYRDTGLDLRDQVRSFIQANSPVTAKLDGRISSGTPAQLPATGGSPSPVEPAGIALAGLLLVGAGLLMRRRERRRPVK
jgi:5'-nucleotidase